MSEQADQVLSAAAVKAAALSVGFDACGIAKAEPLPGYAQQLETRLKAGYHGNMTFLERYTDLRADPCKLLPDARSVICVAASYNPMSLPAERVPVARYAYGEDYHERLKRMLYQLLAKLRETYPDFDGRLCVDSAPIAEKQWASRAGIGWIGRHSLVVHPTLGSWINLGEIVTTWEADGYDQPMLNRCGDCHRCQQACPNGAIIPRADAEQGGGVPSDGYSDTMLNASRCASYHTIENRDDSLPDDIRLSGYLFGCDVCQLVCPYNQQAAKRLEVSEDRLQQLSQLGTCDESTFRKLAKHSPLSRIRFRQLLRNRRQS